MLRISRFMNKFAINVQLIISQRLKSGSDPEDYSCSGSGSTTLVNCDTQYPSAPFHTNFLYIPIVLLPAMVTHYQFT
jgi:hypothetical protein